MLPFADYRENGALDPNHPATAKEVLEDGLLGDIQYNGNFSRQDAPAITVVQNKEGEPVVLQTEATEYIEAVQSIVVNGKLAGTQQGQVIPSIKKLAPLP